MAQNLEEQIEEYELTIEETIVQFTLEELQDLAAGLNIPETKWKEKRKLMVLRLIRQYMEKSLEKKEELQDKNDTLDQMLGIIEEIHEKGIGQEKKKTPSTKIKEPHPK
jgi:hypothetical protein